MTSSRPSEGFWKFSISSICLVLSGWCYTRNLDGPGLILIILSKWNLMISIKIKIRVHTLVLGQVFFFARFKLQQWFRCWEQILVVVAEIVVERCSFLHLQPHKNNKKKHTTFEKFLVCSAHDIYIYIEISGTGGFRLISKVGL